MPKTPKRKSAAVMFTDIAGYTEAMSKSEQKALEMLRRKQDILTVNMVIIGKVQGVGFRYFVLRQAQELGIRGWVNNKPNGDVEALAQGEKADLEQFIAKVKEGPSFSRVEDVSLNWVKEAEQYFGFEII